jgi:hypothetical protein
MERPLKDGVLIGDCEDADGFGLRRHPPGLRERAPFIFFGRAEAT